MTPHEVLYPAEEKSFRRDLSRSVAIPLTLSFVAAIIFIGLVLYLLEASRWVDRSDRIVSQAAHLQRLCVDAETGLRGYLITGEPEFLEPKTRASAEMATAFARLRASVSDNSSQSTRVERIDGLFNEWLKYFDQTVKLRRDGGDYSEGVRSRRGKHMMDEIREIFSQFIELEEQLRDRRASDTAVTVRSTLAITVLLSLVLGALAAFLGRRRLLSLAERFGSNLRKQWHQNQELEQRAWIQTGQAQLTDEFRGNMSLDELCTRSLSFLARYVSAHVGRLFLAEDGGRLVARAAYAFDERVSTAPSFFRIGQGAVGRCALEKKSFTLSNLPADYMQITTGLGTMPVRHVVLLPVVADDAVKAVIELGFAAEPSKTHSRFLDEVVEKLAHLMAAAQYRQQLQALLEETQRQAEELQSQQEELEATNEDLQQKSQELLAQQHNLEQINVELEQQQTVLEEQKEKVEESNRELNRAQEEAREKARSLELASKYKSEFLANMSHELRTPLNSILLLSNLLQENSKATLAAEDIEYSRTIHASASDLLALINDILDLSKVEAGKLDVVAGRMLLKDLTGSLERAFAPQMQQKGLQLKVTIDENAPAHISTDRARCEQILRNFLSNAFKFTERGLVELRVSRPQGTFARYAVDVSVHDSGIGIPPEKQALVFDAFQQADGTISRKYGGTGLGLTIARELSSLLGGEIRLDSVEGRGSTFRLLLPAELEPPKPGSIMSAPLPPTLSSPKSPSRAPEPEEPKPTLGWEDDRGRIARGDKVILIVEDDPGFARVVFDLCRRKGFRCVVALDGESGLADAAQFVPTAIVLDVNLPGLNGIGVLDRLKRNPRTRHIPVHVVSVEARGREALQYGAAGFRAKPTDETKLDSLIDDLVSSSQEQTKRLLVIEDNPVEQDNIRRLIGNGDVITEIASSGAEALEKLSRTSFDCLVLDLKLPDMSGFELLAELDSERFARKPPVIVYTARDLTREEQERLSQVSQSIVLKGARSPERLLDEVTLFLHRVEDRLSPNQKEMLQRVRHREELFVGKKVLLVDDDMRNVFALRSVLLKKGFSVVAAKNGQEALQRLDEHPDVSLVLMDIMMPEMDGYQAIEAIRAREAFRKLPVIALTAKAMRGDRERCLQAGANDYLPKPVDVNSLLSLFRIWLTR